MNENVKLLKDMVKTALMRESIVEEHMIDSRILEIKDFPMFNGISDDEIIQVSSEIKSELAIKLDKGILLEQKGHQKWFLAKKHELDMKYWDRYKNYLLKDKGFSVNVVNTMDDVLDTLTDLLGDPTRNINFQRKGLIIGDVQSGKTANYTGLICKAADAKYKVVVLLTGTIERLRQQTQQRIDEGFVGADSDAMMKQIDNACIGVGNFDSSIRPMVLTSVTDDFKQKNARNLNFDLRNIKGTVVFVVKKNSSILTQLNKWLNQCKQNQDTIDSSILVIDDEADNASINTKEEDSPTVINAHIRELLNAFDKSSYVGFTATPFANIFIDPDSLNDMEQADLFPKDYIYSLDAPSNYIGARNIFEKNGNANYMLVSIDDNPENIESIANILPLRHKASTKVTRMPQDMKEAIMAFMLANTIEDLKGLNGNHRSMLINVSRFKAVQDSLSDLVIDYVKELQSACKLFCRLSIEKALKNEYINELKNVYEKIYCNEKYEWELIQNSLHKSCAGIVVQTVNGNNKEKLSYDEYKDGFRVIAIGGMSLSRGLTLEGLVTSYFYRNSKMYDTLMQMGRWFGYRKDYEELCRIWMSDESINWYEHISRATDELREEIKRYQDSDYTPLDFGLRVRSDINALLVTARNKMKSTESRECLISLSGECIETPEIYSSIEKNKYNMESIQRFVNNLVEDNYSVVCEQLRTKKNRYGFKDIPMIKIVELLQDMDISIRNEHFNFNAIKNFITYYAGNELKKCDVYFVGGDGDTQVDFGSGIKYNVVSRSYSIMNEGKIVKMSGSSRRLGSSGDGRIGLDNSKIEEVKAKAKKTNLVQKDYFRYVKRNPLLLIYVVQLDKEINHTENNTITAEQKEQLYIGLGLGIPTLENQATKYARYVLNKVEIQRMLEDEVEWDANEEDIDD